LIPRALSDMKKKKRTKTKNKNKEKELLVNRKGQPRKKINIK
jgi:hypothetical protein